MESVRRTCCVRCGRRMLRSSMRGVEFVLACWHTRTYRLLWMAFNCSPPLLPSLFVHISPSSLSLAQHTAVPSVTSTSPSVMSLLSVLLLVLVSLTYCTAYQLPDFPEVVTIEFDYQFATPGQRLSQSTTATAPTISLPYAVPSTLYSIILIDPDAPSASQPVMANWLHYLHTNIPGHVLSQQFTLFTTTAPPTLSATYAPPTPPPRTGPHRYVLLVYSQSSKLPLQPPHIEQPNDNRRAKWSLVEWERQAAAAGVTVDLAAGTYVVVEHGVDGEETGELSPQRDIL